MEKNKKVLFLNLTAFSQTGGLEKFNRCFLKALNETEGACNTVTNAYSLYDKQTDAVYYPADKYKGFGKQRARFVLGSVLKALKQDVLILGHINLSIIGVLVKMLSPKTKVMLICHGIEVWEKVQGIQKTMLDKADKILAVSSYTKQKLADVQGAGDNNVVVFHNTIDPYFKMPVSFVKNEALLSRYGLTKNDFILFTLCRLSSSEKYKGYDEVVKAMPALLKKYPALKYVIAGKYDAAEKQRIDELVANLGVKDNVIFTGYVDDNELIDHYQLGDVYIMPSRGEGFGIVFIEAMVCGSRVIAGNKDGSVDALKNGELGLLVDPEDTRGIAAAIEQYIEDNKAWNENKAKALQQKTMENFGFTVYKNRLSGILSAVVNN